MTTALKLGVEESINDFQRQPFAHDTWPVVAPMLPGGLPVEEEFKVPMQPGETRTWFWSKGKDAFPEDYAKGAKVRTYAVRFEGEKDDD